MTPSTDRRIGPVALRRVHFLGLPLDLTDADKTVAACEVLIRQGTPQQIVAINANKVALLHQHPDLARVVQESALNYIDGTSLTFAGYLFGHRFPKKVPGVWLAEKLLEVAEAKGYRPYFLGAGEQVLAEAIFNYRQRYPRLQVAGYHHGYFTDEEQEAIVDDIAASEADMLFVGFSSPRKELWISRYLDRLNVPLCVGVGGSFDVAAGLYTRSPAWMATVGMEWLYRVMQEPRRMWKRYLLTNSRFLFYVLRYRAMGR